MNQTSSITLPQTSTLDVDLSQICTDEVSTQEDKDFLIERGGQILKVVAKAALLVGQQLCEIQDHFREEDGRGTGLVKFYKSIQISPTQAQHWSNKYRTYCAFTEVFGVNEGAANFEKLGNHTASRIWTLPTKYREALLLEIADGNVPTTREVDAIACKPEVKLSKAEELLAAAQARKESADERWEAVKADPGIPKTLADGELNPEYTKAQQVAVTQGRSVANYEQQIADLQAQVEEEKLRTAEQVEARTKAEAIQARVETELQKLKFDDASQRAERVKRLSNSLTISVPQVFADLAKFFTEKDHYEPEVRDHLIEQSTYLTNFIADQLD